MKRFRILFSALAAATAFAGTDGGTAGPPASPEDWAAAVRTNSAALSEAGFRDRFLMPLLRGEALEPLVSGPDAGADWLDEARAYVECELQRAWEGAGSLAARRNEEWGRAYDFTVREGSKDPFLTWMSVVGQKKWHWDDKARDQLAKLEEALAARPADEAPFARLLAAHARQFIDPSPEHRVALGSAAVRWAESHAAHPERSEAVLRVLDQFVAVDEPAFVSALLESEADPWIGLVAAGRSAFALHYRECDPEERERHVADAAVAWRRAWELHPEFPQGAEGMMRIAAHMKNQEAVGPWFRAALAARFDSPALHDRYVAYLRPTWGGSIEALRRHAADCFAAAKAHPGSMLPYGGAIARLAELDVSGEKPETFFRRPGVAGELDAALAPMLDIAAGDAGGATLHVRFESAWFLAAVRWTLGDENGAFHAFSTVRGVPGYYCRRLQESFPGAFDLIINLAGLTDRNASRIRPLRERFLAGDAEGFLERWENELAACESPTANEKELLERLSVRAFLAARFPKGESRRVPITPHGAFSCWHGYGIGWQPEVDESGGYAWFTGRQSYGSFEFGIPLPTPIEIETDFELTPDPATNALFAIRLFPADRLFSDHKGESPVVSVRIGPDDTVLVRLGPSGNGGIDFGCTQDVIAETNLSLSAAPHAKSESHAESTESVDGDEATRHSSLVTRHSPESPPPPTRIPFRVVFLEDRVLCYLGDSSDPVLDAPCSAFAPTALPDGAKLVFYGTDCRFFGFTFRSPVTQSPAEQPRAEPDSAQSSKEP